MQSSASERNRNISLIAHIFHLNIILMGHLNLDLKERHFLIFQVFLFVIPVSIILPPGIFCREFSQTFIEVSFNF